MLKEITATGLAFILTATFGGIQNISYVIPDNILRNVSSHMPRADVKISVVDSRTGAPMQVRSNQVAGGASVGALPILVFIGGLAVRMSAHALK